MYQVTFLDYVCDVTFEAYQNNNRIVIELTIAEDGEPMLTASVNLPNEQLGYNEVAIKNYSENEGILDILINAGIISNPTRFVDSGFANIPICEVLVETNL